MIGLLVYLGIVAVMCILFAAFVVWIMNMAKGNASAQSIEGHVGNLDVFVPLSEDVAAIEAGLPKMGSAE